MTVDVVADVDDNDDAEPTGDGALVKRDRYGRYLILGGNGAAKPYTRVTTIAGTLDDQYGLTKWKVRTAALGLVARPDLALRVAACDPADKSTIDAVCRDAAEAGGASEGANFGTALHEATARADMGETVTLPEPYDADLVAYRDALANERVAIAPEYVERIVVLDELRIAGTIDRIGTLPDGRVVVADLKTGQDLRYSWRSIAIQLALYAHADALYRPDTGFRTDMPPVDRDVALVIHLPAGANRCTLHTVDIAAGWQAAQLALSVRQWRKARDLTAPYHHDADAPAPRSTRDALIARVQAIKDMGELATLALIWPADVPGFKGDHAHTVAELARAATAIAACELRIGAPF